MNQAAHANVRREQNVDRQQGVLHGHKLLTRLTGAGFRCTCKLYCTGNVL
jgi:hypothetical protein